MISVILILVSEFNPLTNSSASRYLYVSLLKRKGRLRSCGKLGQLKLVCTEKKLMKITRIQED